MADDTAPSTTPKPLLGGFAPLLVAAALALLIVLLVPSVAPEHIVSVPAPEAVPASTTTTATTPTTTPVATETTVAP